MAAEVEQCSSTSGAVLGDVGGRRNGGIGQAAMQGHLYRWRRWVYATATETTTRAQACTTRWGEVGEVGLAECCGTAEIVSARGLAAHLAASGLVAQNLRGPLSSLIQGTSSNYSLRAHNCTTTFVNDHMASLGVSRFQRPLHGRNWSTSKSYTHPFNFILWRDGRAV